MPYAMKEPDWPQVNCGDVEMSYDEQIDVDLREIRDEIKWLMGKLETMQREHMALTGVRYYGG